VIWRVAAVLGLAGALLAVALEWIVPRAWRAVADRQIIELLSSPDQQARKEGAWRSAARPPGPPTELIIAELSQGRERDPGVRESFAYALGRLRLQRCLPLLLRVAREDPSGYVRQAAWIAAARVDFARFREAARELESSRASNSEDSADTWGRIGIAAARMEHDDLSDLQFLLDVAASGTDFQRNIAGVALNRYLRPLLRAAGRWPLKTEISAEGAWSPAFVAEIRRRAASLDLAQIAAYSRPEQQGTESLRRMIRRIYGARARVVRVLYSIEAE
jgi:HEAT repeat protein